MNGNCLTRKSKDGKISYDKYILECKLVIDSLVISLAFEFIENEIRNFFNLLVLDELELSLSLLFLSLFIFNHNF